jgi:hypothetical protein
VVNSVLIFFTTESTEALRATQSNTLLNADSYLFLF